MALGFARSSWFARRVDTGHSSWPKYTSESSPRRSHLKSVRHLRSLDKFPYNLCSFVTPVLCCEVMDLEFEQALSMLWIFFPCARYIDLSLKSLKTPCFIRSFAPLLTFYNVWRRSKECKNTQFCWNERKAFVFGQKTAIFKWFVWQIEGN